MGGGGRTGRRGGVRQMRDKTLDRSTVPQDMLPFVHIFVVWLDEVQL